MTTLLVLALIFQQPGRDRDEIAEPRKREEAIRKHQEELQEAEEIRLTSINGMPMLFEPRDVGKNGEVLPFVLEAAILDKKSFDLYVFGQTDGLLFVKTNLRRLLVKKIETLKEVKDLTPDQSAKLHLAGLGDIERLFGRIEEQRREFDLDRSEFRKASRILTSMRPLIHETLDGPFGINSLFVKTLATLVKP